MSFDDWWCRFVAGVESRTSDQEVRSRIQPGSREQTWFRGDWALGRCPDECAERWCATALERRAGGMH